MADFDKHFTKLFSTGLVHLASILVFAYLPVAHAELYKWVDKDGNVNYTQSPPPAGIKATTIKPPPSVASDPANENLKQRLDNLDLITEQRQKQTEDDQKSGEDQAVTKRLCDQAKSRLASYERPRVTVTAADGASRVLTDEERLKEIEKSQGQVKELCK